MLHTKAKEVPETEIKNKKLQDIIQRMERVIAENDEALAVAAPQIGESLRIFVISEWAKNPASLVIGKEEEKQKSQYKNLVFINPKTIKQSKAQKKFPEGCLSVPGRYDLVKRADKIKIEALDRNGKKFTYGASGLMAQAIQHEMDHLDGVLFVDKKKK